MEHMIHEIKPVFNHESKILILGSFPSVKSREGQFFYHHPQNRFWKVLAASLCQPVPATVEEKTIFLLSNHIAVWDVIASCDIQGSSDSSIRNVTPNDLTNLLAVAPIRTIYTNGGTSHKLFQKYMEPNLKREAVKLPSTSPANASWSLERLIGVWGPALCKGLFPGETDRNFTDL
ncbi:DNA-deoxyinosine glycosylase [Anaerostipes sp.]|uniref:DNA-deoxyinosine glycosylase n=1 Tax=Anaerostipes sp. TaxID=1872530 RepID=UPI0025B98F77|nr:DNA-deoxyinosine glycosylase [Anaerostipes sp.]MBS7009731.1 DNA-deoxyinosine glycosylase [Anaerostipes sp.]